MEKGPVAPLRAMQPTSEWTFASALALFGAAPDDYTSDAINEFLTLNNEVFLQALPLEKQTQQMLQKGKKEFLLRGILYENITDDDIDVATELAKIAGSDALDTLRAVVQARNRTPIMSNSKNPKKLRSLLPDDNASHDQLRKLLFYLSALLRERRTVLQIAATCHRNRYNESSPIQARDIGTTIALLTTYALALVASVKSVCERLVAGQILDLDEHVTDILVSEAVLYICDALRMLAELYVVSINGPGEVVKAWFDLAQNTDFFAALVPFAAHREQALLMQGLSTVVSIELLDIQSTMAPNSDSYLNDAEIFRAVNEAVVTSTCSPVVSYAWMIVLFKKSVVLEEVQPQRFLSIFLLHEAKETVAKLQADLSGQDVFSVIASLARFLLFDKVHIVVLSALIISALPFLTMTPKIALTIRDVLSQAPDLIVERFFENADAQQALLLSRAKFPYSLSMFLRLAAINGNFAFSELTEVKSYMDAFDKIEFGRNYDIDSENTDLVKLTDPVLVFPAYELNQKLSLLLSVNTKAKIIPTADSEKVLVTFLYDFNGWAYLGRVIENISKTFDSGDAKKLELLADILYAVERAANKSNLPSLLNYMSAYVDDSDIVDVFFRLLEQCLHHRLVDQLAQLLGVFAKFIDGIPQRVWPYLSSSSLLSNNGKEGFVLVLFGSNEIVRGEYPFTMALVNFVCSLANNCLEVRDDYSEHEKGEILGKFVDHLLRVFESSTAVKYEQGTQKLELGTQILNCFELILKTVYSITSSDKVPKPTRMFSRAAHSIIGAFLLNDAPFASPIFALISNLSTDPNFYAVQDVSQHFAHKWIVAAFDFLALLVSTRSSIAANPSIFEKKLFQVLGDLVTIYSENNQRAPVIELISALTSAKWDKDMPSMLSHLGEEKARIFLHLLASDLSNSLDDYAVKVSIYKLLCLLMEAPQQGLSVLFINGRDVFNDSKKESVSLLSILKKNVSHVKHYPNFVIVHLLDAIALAFNSWTGAKDNDLDIAFVLELVGMLDKFVKPEPAQSAIELIVLANETKLHARVAEILSLVLFTTQDEKCKKIITTLLSSKTFLAKALDYFGIVSYQEGLFDSVNQQFELHSEFLLSDFIQVNQLEFRSDSIYNIALMDPFFKENPLWTDLRRLVELLSANIHYHTAQTLMASAVGTLLTAFARKVAAQFPSEYLDVVHDILDVRSPSDLFTEKSLVREYAQRCEISFLLTLTSDPKKLAKPAQLALTIVSSCEDILRLLTDESIQSSIRKPLLRTLSIALNIVSGDLETVVSNFSVLAKIFDHVLAKGVKYLVLELQNDVYILKTQSKLLDLSEKLDVLRLMLLILRTFVLLELSPASFSELGNLLSRNDTVSTILGLYSFSHLLLVNDEPVFAQIGLLFAQDLLTVDVFASMFAGHGMFLVLRESVISQPLRSGGITIESMPLVHRVWTNGILPILVTALAKTDMLGEVLITLQAFGKQIQTALSSWSHDSSSLTISSSGIWETTQILLIYQILAAVAKSRNAVASGPNDVDMAVLPGLETPQKRENFVDYVNNMLKHPKFLALRITASTPEEHTILQEKSGERYTAFVQGLLADIQDLPGFMV